MHNKTKGLKYVNYKLSANVENVHVLQILVNIMIIRISNPFVMPFGLYSSIYYTMKNAQLSAADIV